MISDITLGPLGAIYGIAMRARRALYRARILPAHEIGVPTISVGNMTTGGTGKTPLVEWVARAAAREGRHPCILTRGYGRARPNTRVVVSDGERVMADAGEGGDEPRLLAEMLQGTAAVISDADRVAAARWALENLGSDLFILDDGFQHLRMARHLDIVAIDATNPWGSGRLLPHGRLREPLRELARTDAIVITRADLASDIDALRLKVKSLSGARPVLLSRMRKQRVRPLVESPTRVCEGTDSAPRTVAAFCAIGNPGSFFTQVRSDGSHLSFERAYPDHHIYTQSEVDILCQEAKAHGAQLILTTAKDAVKLRSLRFDLPCYVLEIAIEFDDEDQMLELIRQAIRNTKRPR